MTEQRFEVVTRDYCELIEAIRTRRKALGLSQMDVDHISGLPDGYTGKLENYSNAKHGRNLGPVSMGFLLGALGLEVVVRAVPDPNRSGQP